MRALIQRVSEANVTIDKEVHGSIGAGYTIFIGIEQEDTIEDINWLVQKIVNLRIFNDIEGKMNINLGDIQGEILVISQFTLHASIKKGNRPSYIKAARPETAIPMYELFITQLRNESKAKVETGVFGADMKVQLINDGPVTIWMDSKNKE